MDEEHLLVVFIEMGGIVDNIVINWSWMEEGSVKSTIYSYSSITFNNLVITFINSGLLKVKTALRITNQSSQIRMSERNRYSRLFALKKFNAVAFCNLSPWSLIIIFYISM